LGVEGGERNDHFGETELRRLKVQFRSNKLGRLPGQRHKLKRHGGGGKRVKQASQSRRPGSGEKV